MRFRAENAVNQATEYRFAGFCSFYRPKFVQQVETQTSAANTRLCPLAGFVHFGSFAPAFFLSHSDKERSRKPPNAHSLSR